MPDIDVFYVKGLRESEDVPKPDLRIVEAVSRINEAYETIGIEHRLRLIDIDSFLKQLNLDDLISIAGHKDTKDNLIELIQTPISFEEARTRAGIVFKDGEWYQDDERLKPVNLMGVEIDQENYRFRKEFDVKRSKGKRFLEKHQKYYKGVLKKIVDEYQFTQKMNIQELETSINKNFARAFFEGKTESLSVYSTDGTPILDGCAFYINSIEHVEKRKNEFQRFLYIINKGLKENKKEKYIRVLASPEYEDQVCEYPNIPNIRKVFQKDNPFYFLFDKYDPGIEIKNYCDLIYTVLRHNNLLNTGSAGNSKTLTVEGVQFLLLHELAHHEVMGQARELQFNLIKTNNDEDPRLMAAPVHYNHFNPEKLSIKSIKEAYKDYWNAQKQLKT